MNNKYNHNDVVQFTEKHKWAGCFGIIDKVKECDDEEEIDYRYLIGVPVPENGVAHIFSMESDEEFEVVGTAILGYGDEEDDE